MANSDNVVDVLQVLFCLTVHLVLEVVDTLDSIGTLITAVTFLVKTGRPFRLIQRLLPFGKLFLRHSKFFSVVYNLPLDLLVVSLL